MKQRWTPCISFSGNPRQVRTDIHDICSWYFFFSLRSHRKSTTLWIQATIASRPSPFLHQGWAVVVMQGTIKLSQKYLPFWSDFFLIQYLVTANLLTVFQCSDNFCVFSSVSVGRWEDGTAQFTILLMFRSESSWLFIISSNISSASFSPPFPSEIPMTHMLHIWCYISDL